MLLKGDKRRTCVRCLEKRQHKPWTGERGKSVRNKRYREKHRERLIAADKARYLRDREIRLTKAKAYYQRKKDKKNVL
jgi:hypothetical protein